MQVSSNPQTSQMTKRARPQMTPEHREKIQDLKQKMAQSKNEAPQKTKSPQAKPSERLALSGEEALALRQKGAS